MTTGITELTEVTNHGNSDDNIIPSKGIYND